MDEETIKKRIKDFTWYSPVDFGNGLVAYGNFKVETKNLDSFRLGLGKWNYIIERNLPNVQGKRIMDIGCNNGIFCVQLAKMGAIDIIGIDSEKGWPNWLKQAEFVKEALEWRCKTKYPINFINSDMANIPELNLGRFDIVLALNCIYYLEEENMINLLKHLKDNTDILLIQCNSRKDDQPPEVYRRATPKFIGTMLQNVGFPFIRFDKPILYRRPVVIGSNYPFEDKGPMPKIDKIRHLIRSWI